MWHFPSLFLDGIKWPHNNVALLIRNTSFLFEVLFSSSLGHYKIAWITPGSLKRCAERAMFWFKQLCLFFLSFEYLLPLRKASLKTQCVPPQCAPASVYRLIFRRWLSHVWDRLLGYIDNKSSTGGLVTRKQIVSMAMTKPRCRVLIFSISDLLKNGKRVFLSTK